MLRHNFEINKPMFELANSVRFTEYLRAIFISLPPNIYISTSALRFRLTDKSKVIQHIITSEFFYFDITVWCLSLVRKLWI